MAKTDTTSPETSSPPPWSPLPLIRVLVLNGVPLYGVFVAGWSWGTILALYWCESFLGGLFILLRMTIHRGLTRKRGYWRGQLGLIVSRGDKEPRAFKAFIPEFLTATLTFNLAHGVFLAFLLHLLQDREPGAAIHAADLKRGVLVTALLLFGSFVLDLQGIRDRPFAWIRAIAKGSMGRTMVIHMTIILGMFATIFFPTSYVLFKIFAVFKLLLELGGALPGFQTPEEAPTWITWLAGKGRPGVDFEKEWRKDRKTETRQVEQDELVRGR
jgi:hypothetical protein